MRLPIRLSVATAVVTAALAAGAGPALADPGAPGDTYPEQPGDHVEVACAALNNPGAIGGASAVRAPIADSITSRLVVDACFGG